MLCLTCHAAAAHGPYREGPGSTGRALLQVVHPTGARYARCESCEAAFFDRDELVALEGRLRHPGVGGRKPLDPRELLARAYASAHRPEGSGEETVPRSCPACDGALIPREWGIGSLVFVDTCFECRGVWLDPGELEALERLFRAGR